MKALVCLSAPVFLETTVGPANTIFRCTPGLRSSVFQEKKSHAHHPEAPNPHQTRARGVDRGEAPGAGGVVREKGAQNREGCDGHDEGVNRQSLLLRIGSSRSSWGRGRRNLVVGERSKKINYCN
jgi:hypothetical protein